jgi:hypothetical protein
MEMKSHLLRKARREFEEFGRVMADTADRLISAGILITELEAKWAEYKQ